MSKAILLLAISKISHLLMHTPDVQVVDEWKDLSNQLLQGKSYWDELEESELDSVLVLAKEFCDKYGIIYEPTTTEVEVDLDLSTDSQEAELKSESDLTTELAETKAKLEVAKTFLRELDGKLSKYESLDIDSISEALDRYESLGSVADLSLLKTKTESSEVTTMKDNSPKCEKCESTNLSLVDGGMLLCEDCGHKQEEVTSATDKVDATAVNTSDVAKMEAELSAYRQLGSIDDIQRVFTHHDTLIDNHQSLKHESSHSALLLSAYESIGTPAEITEVVEKFEAIQMKFESERIAQDLNISVAKVAITLSKFESVSEAEALLRTLYSKDESDDTAAGAEVTDETTDKKPLPKSETDDEEAEEITEVKPVATDDQKAKAESANLRNLRELCHKL